jgi:hypothetical protein
MHHCKCVQGVWLAASCWFAVLTDQAGMLRALQARVAAALYSTLQAMQFAAAQNHTELVVWGGIAKPWALSCVLLRW